MSNNRKQLEGWLKTLEIEGTVLDVGGIHFPVRGRTKTWNVTEYEILDSKSGYRGMKADYVENINLVLDFKKQFNNVFCLEVLEYVYDPMTAIRNLSWFLKRDGKLFISTHFIFPHHSGGEDCMRYTRTGITKLLTKVGLEIISITPRMAKSDDLTKALDLESKIQYNRGEIGHLIIARKC